MSIVQTVLIYIGIPVVAFALLAVVTLGPGASRAPRYRPGSPWQSKPVWYLPHPEHSGPVSSLEVRTNAAASSRLALQGSVAEPVKASGGASGEW